jgi:hypothetical protein
MSPFIGTPQVSQKRKPGGTTWPLEQVKANAFPQTPQNLASGLA